MSVVRLRTPAEIEEEAAVWVWRLDSGELSAQERREFDDWLRADIRNKRAFEELNRMWASLDGLAEAKRDEKIATFAMPHPLPPRMRPRRRFMAWTAAAGLVLALTTAWWLRDGQEAQTLSTAVGQQRTVKLADGSTVALNTNTIVETRFGEDRREVWLRKGEAHFTVAHNTTRPFQVHAGDVLIQALGTAFNVRVHGADDVEVLVTEGRVKVARGQNESQARPPMELSLGAGERVKTADPELKVAAVAPQTVNNALAWRDGAIVFNGVPLSHAIAELNRYAEARLIVSDPQTGALRVGGRYRTGDLDEFLRALETALPVQARRTGEGLIYIERQ